MARRRPRSMKVLGQKFVIEYTHHLTARAAEVVGHDKLLADTDGADEIRLLGHCLSDDNTIALNLDQGPDRMRETVLHESIHAMFDKTDILEDDDNLEEAVIGRLSPVLLLWLRENKALVAYLQEQP